MYQEHGQPDGVGGDASRLPQRGNATGELNAPPVSTHAHHRVYRPSSIACSTHAPPSLTATHSDIPFLLVPTLVPASARYIPSRFIMSPLSNDKTSPPSRVLCCQARLIFIADRFSRLTTNLLWLWTAMPALMAWLPCLSRVWTPLQHLPLVPMVEVLTMATVIVLETMLPKEIPQGSRRTLINKVQME